jgi:hypothetical protein
MRMMVAAICGFLVIAIPQPASAGAWCAWYDAYTYNCGFTPFSNANRRSLVTSVHTALRIISNDRESSAMYRSNSE